MNQQASSKPASIEERIFQGVKEIYLRQGVILKMLEDINRRLEALESSSSATGLSDRPIWLFVRSVGDGSPWYTLEGDGKRVNVSQPRLTGIVQKVACNLIETDGENRYKLDVFVLAGQTVYVVRSGIETYFSQQLLFSLAALGKGIKKSITIQASPGKKAVFCKVFQNDTEISYEQPTSYDWQGLIESIQGNLKGGC